MQQEIIRLKDYKRKINLIPLLLIILGFVFGIVFTQWCLAEITELGKLTELLRDKPAVVAAHMIKSSEAKTSLGDAYDLVIADLLKVYDTVTTIESRAHLSDADKIIIRASDETAVFDVKDSPDIKKITGE